MSNEDTKTASSTVSAQPSIGVTATAAHTPKAAAAAASPPRKPATQQHVEVKDNFRELVETVVFVVVLVLLLKSFVAEAFVIPTGSMAETLWGYQKLVPCPKCKYTFPVNCSSEVDPPEPDRRAEVTGCTCPNCRYTFSFRSENMDPSPSSGDRVLVSKYIYDTVTPPQRGDVVVFKYPVEPQKKYVPMNYIKRLCGLPGETIAIYYGDLYVTKDFAYPDRQKADTDDQQRTLMHESDLEARELFHKLVENRFAAPIDGKKFEMVRKDPAKMMAMRRLVSDNEYQPSDQIGIMPPRWQPKGTGWNVDNEQQPRKFVHKAGSGNDDLDWLEFRNFVRDSGPELINDFMGYNSAISGPHVQPRGNWVGDLILECNVNVEQAQGQFVLELRKGVDRFQARFELATGICKLVRLSSEPAPSGAGGSSEQTLATAATELRKPGRFSLRFANVDERLTVWVDSTVPFGDGVIYPPPKQRGPTEKDLQPARIGVSHSLATIDQLKLWRDTYYTLAASEADAGHGEPWDFKSPVWHEANQWERLRDLPVKTLYVQPDHFLCLGDNSPESADGRYWGLVPRRLMLGRALLVYYPLSRAGPIR